MNGSEPHALNYLEELSHAYGTGDPLMDLLIGGIIFALIAIIAGFFASRASSSRRQPLVAPRPEGPMGLGGRVEKLEMSLSNFRTETLRAVEHLRSDVALIKEDVAAICVALKIPPSSTGGPDGGDEEEESFDEGGQGALAPIEGAPVSLEPQSLAVRLTKTRRGFFDKLKGIFRGSPKLDPNAIDELEMLLVSSDLGIKTVSSLLDQVKSDLQRGDVLGEEELARQLRDKVQNILEADVSPTWNLEKRGSGPTVIMMVGVNGVGKTTTAAKLGALLKSQGSSVLLVAADTFRAAAVEQLKEWGARLEIPVASGAEDAKPASVVFDAMVRAKEEGIDFIIVDTAGRLHTKISLMQELEGIRNAISRHVEGAPHETFLVVDGSTGQNALVQAREFNDAARLSGIIVTKLDGTSKGGIVVAIKDELGIPIRFIGVGEAAKDLRLFVPSEFAEAIFDTSKIDGSEARDPLNSTPLSAHGETRRRKRRESESYLQ